jgi:hypothetical protein
MTKVSLVLFGLINYGIYYAASDEKAKLQSVTRHRNPNDVQLDAQKNQAIVKRIWENAGVLEKHSNDDDTHTR